MTHVPAVPTRVKKALTREQAAALLRAAEGDRLETAYLIRRAGPLSSNPGHRQAFAERLRTRSTMALLGCRSRRYRRPASSEGPCDVVAPLAAAGGRSSVSRSRTGLLACTVGAAAAGAQSDKRGELSPGLRADLVELEGKQLVETWVVGGVLAHSRKTG